MSLVVKMSLLISCSNYVDKIRFSIMLTSIQAPLGIPPFNDSTILRSLLVNAFRKDVSFQGFCDLLWLCSEPLQAYYLPRIS